MGYCGRCSSRRCASIGGESGPAAVCRMCRTGSLLRRKVTSHGRVQYPRPSFISIAFLPHGTTPNQVFGGHHGRCSEWGGEITAAVGSSPTDGGATPNTNRRRWGIAAALLGRTRPLHAASLPGARPLANSSRSRLRASPLQLVRAPPSSPAPQRPPSPRLLFQNQHRRLSHLIHHESNPQQVMSRSRTGTARAPSRSARSAGHRRAPRDPPVPEGAPLLPPCLHAPSINARPRDRPGLQN